MLYLLCKYSKLKPFNCKRQHVMISTRHMGSTGRQRIRCQADKLNLQYTIIHFTTKLDHPSRAGTIKHVYKKRNKK